jgi:lysozyme
VETSANGILLIKGSESCKLKAYLDSVNVPTIGYGHTEDVKMGDIIDQETADEFLVYDLKGVEKDINSLKLNLNQNQFDSLVDFTFNLGFGSLLSSTLLKLIKSADTTIDEKTINVSDIVVEYNQTPLKEQIRQDYYKISKLQFNFLRWSFAGGKFLKGLYSRRKTEYELFIS